jgi:hypothetical protein
MRSEPASPRRAAPSASRPRMQTRSPPGSGCRSQTINTQCDGRCVAIVHRPISRQGSNLEARTEPRIEFNDRMRTRARMWACRLAAALGVQG